MTKYPSKAALFSAVFALFMTGASAVHARGAAAPAAYHPVLHPISMNHTFNRNAGYNGQTWNGNRYGPFNTNVNRQTTANGGSANGSSTTTSSGRGRINAVDTSLTTQQMAIGQGATNGTLAAQQVAIDSTGELKIADELTIDEAQHDGYITKPEATALNTQLTAANQTIQAGTQSSGTPAALPAGNVANNRGINRVDNLLDRQQATIDTGATDGTLAAQQVASDSAAELQVADQLNVDLAQDHGSLTRADARQLNADLRTDKTTINGQLNP